MSTNPRVALWGAGMISQVHAAACQQLGWPIAAVASRSSSRAYERAQQVGADSMDYAALVDTPSADTVIVSTPPQRHADDVLALLDAGWAVVVEKPLCTTLAQADAIVSASERPGRRLLYAENIAYSPVVGAVLRRVPDLGSLTSLEARALQGLPNWGGFLTPEWGGGALFDLGVHPIAVTLLIARAARAGAVVAVSAELRGSSIGTHDTDEWGRIRIEFESGLTGAVTASWRDAVANVWDVQAASPSGVLRAEINPTSELEYNGEPVPLDATSAATSGATPSPANPIERLGYAGQLAAFGDDIAHGRSPVMDARFGREVLEIVCAAYQSAGLDGATVLVPFDGPRDRTPLELWKSPTKPASR